MNNLVVLCVMGESCSGKSTLIKNLTDKYKNLHYVKSYSTNYKRKSVEEDSTHIYVDAEKFHDDLVHGKILATYISPNGYINWVSKDLFMKDKVNVLAIDPIAFDELMENQLSDEEQYYGIYLKISKKEKIKRLKQRGEDIEKMLSEPHLQITQSTSMLTHINNWCILNADYSEDEMLKNTEKAIKYFGWCDLCAK